MNLTVSFRLHELEEAQRILLMDAILRVCVAKSTVIGDDSERFVIITDSVEAALRVGFGSNRINPTVLLITKNESTVKGLIGHGTSMDNIRTTSIKDAQKELSGVIDTWASETSVQHFIRDLS